MGTLNIVIASVAVAVSVSSLIFSIWTWNRSRVTSLRPLLIFEYDGTKGWLLRNLGNGPALDVIVAMRPIKGEWIKPVRVPPLSRDGLFLLEWLDHTNIHALGAIYVDLEHRRYTSTCANDLTNIVRGQHLKKWHESEIGRHWSQVCEGKKKDEG